MPGLNNSSPHLSGLGPPAGSQQKSTTDEQRMSGYAISHPLIRFPSVALPKNGG
jgi:hypothetical protein